MITCKFEHGHEAHLRHTVVDILVLQDGKILLVRRAPHLLSGGKWGLVGGFTNQGETLEQNAHREILEETGYKIIDLKLIAIVDNPQRPDDRKNIAFVYTAQASKKVGEPDNESSEVRWFELDKLPKEDEFAFDHYEMIKLYLDHLKNPESLPMIISSWK